jgi:uncharacterized protein
MKRIGILLKNAKTLYDNGDPGHDFAHIHRVVANCRKIGLVVGANLSILLPAAILHDIVNLPKNHPERLAATLSEKSQARLSPQFFRMRINWML